MEVASKEVTEVAVAERLRAQGVDARVTVLPVDEEEAARLFPLRCDLSEHTFTRSHA
ncbi:hypothetical protein [Streptomyces sp. NBC_01439]|uniref:hypothetical protein n=1 Tax=Streptomyces sp. NBC_01439 TaxID=2903867 RepID=UPI002E2DB102|nr:hypothetical protein [Streptomyces sp. NBC_01439]